MLKLFKNSCFALLLSLAAIHPAPASAALDGSEDKEMLAKITAAAAANPNVCDFMNATVAPPMNPGPSQVTQGQGYGCTITGYSERYTYWTYTYVSVFGVPTIVPCMAVARHNYLVQSVRMTPGVPASCRLFGPQNMIRFSLLGGNPIPGMEIRVDGSCYKWFDMANPNAPGVTTLAEDALSNQAGTNGTPDPDAAGDPYIYVYGYSAGDVVNVSVYSNIRNTYGRTTRTLVNSMAFTVQGPLGGN